MSIFDTDQKLPELELSPLQKERLEYRPSICDSLQNLENIDFQENGLPLTDTAIVPSFTQLSYRKTVIFAKSEKQCAPLKIGVVLSGGQAAGGHNVISGLYDALIELNPDSTLIGFLNGPGGIIRNKTLEITKELLANFRNQGGFDLIGSGRTKIETPEQFKAAHHAVNENELDGLIIVGGDDSNTNAAFLAEYFYSLGCKTCVVGVPKTIDGDLQNEAIELPFGFDTACKTYSEIIGNIARDCISAKKYYYFIKLMGRSASHITLECALQSQPNLALIGEEIEAKKMKLTDVVQQLADLVKDRSKLGFDYGVVLVPEGIVEFMPDIRALILELNKMLARGSVDAVMLERTFNALDKINYVISKLSAETRDSYKLLPQDIQLQLLIDRDPHGNVQVSRIDSERLLMQLTRELLTRTDPSIKFSCQPIFCGYEGRSSLPSNFDANYCYNLGRLAALLVARKRSGFMVSFGKLAKPVDSWEPRVTPLVSMLTIEERDGKSKVVIKKALVDLKGKAFADFAQKRTTWRLKDQYCQRGPIQFFGPSELTDTVPLSLVLNRS